MKRHVVCEILKIRFQVLKTIHGHLNNLQKYHITMPHIAIDPSTTSTKEQGRKTFQSSFLKLLYFNFNDVEKS